MKQHPILYSLFLALVNLCFLFPFEGNGNLEKRGIPLALKTSVIIPCDYRHFHHLIGLLDHYHNQSIRPDEIVISLSEYGKISENEIYEIQGMPWLFHLKIVLHENKLSAGSNRNRACASSAGHLLITQDADDVPHPKRIEMIKYLFEHYHVDHLIHLWIPPEKDFIDYKLEELEGLSDYCNDTDVLSFWSDNGGKVKGSITNGNVAFTREVFDSIKWPEQGNIGEDIGFNKAVYDRFDFKVIINAELLIYRNFLSSFLLPQD